MIKVFSDKKIVLNLRKNLSNTLNIIIFLLFQVLKTLRKFVPQIPFSRYILPAFCDTTEREALQASLPPLSDPVSVTRTFCGALFFPTIAAFLGSALYENVPSQLKRTLLGGATFVIVKGVLKIYHKQHNYIRQCQRQILDYKEDS